MRCSYQEWNLIRVTLAMDNTVQLKHAIVKIRGGCHLNHIKSDHLFTVFLNGTPPFFSKLASVTIDKGD
jgi:hypothetical protein